MLLITRHKNYKIKRLMELSLFLTNLIDRIHRCQELKYDAFDKITEVISMPIRYSYEPSINKPVVSLI